MNDTIKQNNELRETQLLSGKATEMSKAEYIAMNVISGLVSGKNPKDIDIDEITTKAVEITKMLVKKIG